MSDQKFVDITELCRRFSLKPWTVRTWCSQKRIPYIRAGGKKVLFDTEEIERWLREQTVQPREPRLTVEV